MPAPMAPARKKRRTGHSNGVFSTVDPDEVPARTGGRNPTLQEFVLPPDLEDTRGKIYRYYQEFPDMIDDKTTLFSRKWTKPQLENELERCRKVLQPAATFQFLRQTATQIVGTVETIGCQRGYPLQELTNRVTEDPEFDMCLRQVMVEYNIDFSKFLRPEFRLLWLIYGKATMLNRTVKQKTDIHGLMQQPITLPVVVHPPQEAEKEKVESVPASTSSV
jgi:hypothetical protein